MEHRLIGLVAGLVLGLALVLGGFFEMIVVAFFGIAGYVVAKVIDGDIAVGDYVGGERRRRS